ncbi:ABC transporter substrate-binding protein [Mesorhizobium sp. M0590]|uniref:ABC transporter substrate-binding protein n=1 Tax=Mesorhizobium sp. M0590 TaxID=2956966 RepID=UPI003334C8D8
MWKELEHLGRQVALNQLSKRDFLVRAATLGLSAAFANSVLVSAASAEAPQNGGILKAGLEGGDATDTLDTAIVNSRSLEVFHSTWGETLLSVTPDGSIEYRIAEEILPSKDLKSWAFRIRRGVQFHNGKEVTPQDVVATVERHADKNSKSMVYGLLQGIESLKADGGDVIMTLKEPNADFPYLLTDFRLPIQPNGGKDNPAEGIGAGPYKVTVFEPGVRYGGEKFKGYWQGDKLGHADQVEITIINDATARMAALRSGQVHMVDRIPPKLADLIKSVPGVTIQNIAGSSCCVFNMLCDTAPFDNNDLRLALKFAVDREQMLEKIQVGYGAVGNDFPINEAFPDFPDSIEQRRFDPEQAKYLYKKSGHSGPILLRTSEAAFAGATDAAQLYQQSAAKAGISIEVKREPGDGYWSEVWKKQPFCASYWDGKSTQDVLYSYAYQSTAATNDTHFANEKFDKLLLQARSELNHANRKNIYREMAIIVRDKGGVVVPMFNQHIDATGPNVHGFVRHPAKAMGNGYALSQCWLAG